MAAPAGDLLADDELDRRVRFARPLRQLLRDRDAVVVGENGDIQIARQQGRVEGLRRIGRIRIVARVDVEIGATHPTILGVRPDRVRSADRGEPGGRALPRDDAILAPCPSGR